MGNKTKKVDPKAPKSDKTARKNGAKDREVSRKTALQRNWSDVGIKHGVTRLG